MLRKIRSWAFVLVGATIAAFAVEEFLSPNRVFDGGVTGVSMVVSHFTPLSLGMCVVLINLPFLALGLKRLGKRFLLKATIAIVTFSIMTVVFEPMRVATRDDFLATIFGGLTLGIGVGLVLRGGGCLDGTEIVAILLSRRTQFSVGQVVLAINVVIYAIAGALFGLDHGMYSLIMYFITSRVIDIVEVGWDTTKALFVITDDGSELAQQIFTQLGRTATIMKGRGLVSNQSKDIVYCVVTRGEIFELKSIVEHMPGSSFATISDVSEIVGHHIKSET